MSWKISNFLWFEKEFVLVWDVKSGDIITLSTVLTRIPSYGGFLNISLDGEYNPVFEFDASSFPDSEKKWDIISENAFLFVYSKQSKLTGYQTTQLLLF